MQIEVKNPSTQGNNKTSLSQPIQAGVSALPVYSNQGFSASTLVLIENLGVASAEIVQVTGVTGSGYIDVTPTTLSHPQSATISFIEADKAQIYKSTTGASGQFSLYQTINITPNSLTTNYFDNVAGANSAYYSVLYNSLTGWTSGQSSIVTSAGYANGTFIDLRERARKLFKDSTHDFIDDSELGIYINEKYQMMQQMATTINKNYRLLYESPVVETNLMQQEYPLPADFWQIKYVLTALNASVAGNNPPNLNFYTAMPAKMETIFNIQYGYYPYMANNGYNFNMLAMPGIFEFYYINGQNLGFYPFFQGQYKLLYYPTSIFLINDSDMPYTPLNDFGYMMVDYAVLRAYQKSGRADLERVTYFQKKVEEESNLLVNYLQEREVQFNPSVETTDTRYLDPVENDIFFQYFTT